MPSTVAPARRMPLPHSEPPYDDELHSGSFHRPAGVLRAVPDQPTLDLEHALPSGLPAAPQLRAPVRLVALPSANGMDDVEARAEPRRPTSSSELPEPRRWAARLAQAVLESLGGRRPVQQLSRWLDEAVFAALSRSVRASGRPRAARSPQVVVRSVRAARPTSSTVEACVVVQVGRRARAVALRLEGLDGRWMCTALDVI
ncbi:MAG TPA: Rv3235 family protein [Jiangellaceae bacterium]|nr:Rv3235 family protein [Jiangellaceae bacterium]